MDRNRKANTQAQTSSVNTSKLTETFDLQSLSAKGLKQDLSELAHTLRRLWARTMNPNRI